MYPISPFTSKHVWHNANFCNFILRNALSELYSFCNCIIAGMPGVVGAVDGAHIAIIAPGHHHANYVNRKGFHRIVAQLICDHKMMFMSINVGWPGSVHDARVFRTSRIGRRIISNTLLPAHFHLVGDAAYPLCTNLMTPFKDNYCQSSTRIVIERSIGQLKGRFRKLKMLDCSQSKVQFY